MKTSHIFLAVNRNFYTDMKAVAYSLRQIAYNNLCCNCLSSLCVYDNKHYLDTYHNCVTTVY